MAARYIAALACAAVVDVAILVSRIIEIVNGHTPSDANTTCFVAAITGTFALIAAGRTWHS